MLVVIQDFESLLKMNKTPSQIPVWDGVYYLFLVILSQDEIRIYNIIGEYVMVGVQNPEPLRIDISSLPPGLYTINCGGQFAKFVKM